MGKLAIYKYFSFMMLVITALVAVMTILGLFGGNANPVHETALAMIVYILPPLVIANAIILLFWVIRRRWHWAAIPGITLLFSIPYIGTIFQFPPLSSDDSNNGGFRVASYNVAVFGREITGFKAEDILMEMKNQNVDILCLQEYAGRSGDKNNTEKFRSYFPSMAKGHDDMVIFSRSYPIVNSGTIEFGHTNNSAMWADICINERTVRVFNVHMETTGFNRTLRKIAKIEMKGSHVEDNAIIRAIYANYTRGMVVRAVQADLVAREMAKSPYPIIVCGDFNDVPYSFVYNKMKGNLIDGFKECGEGFMYTFRGKKKVRIDYIFHDEAITGQSYYTRQINYSDHYPVFMEMSF